MEKEATIGRLLKAASMLEAMLCDGKPAARNGCVQQRQHTPVSSQPTLAAVGHNASPEAKEGQTTLTVDAQRLTTFSSKVHTQEIGSQVHTDPLPTRVGVHSLSPSLPLILQVNQDADGAPEDLGGASRYYDHEARQLAEHQPQMPSWQKGVDGLYFGDKLDDPEQALALMMVSKAPTRGSHKSKQQQQQQPPQLRATSAFELRAPPADEPARAPAREQQQQQLPPLRNAPPPQRLQLQLHSTNAEERELQPPSPAFNDAVGGAIGGWNTAPLASSSPPNASRLVLGQGLPRLPQVAGSRRRGSGRSGGRAEAEAEAEAQAQGQGKGQGRKARRRKPPKLRPVPAQLGALQRSSRG